MITIGNPSDCCGCSACASICNNKAISMVPDGLGFLYPKVDKEKCTDCGLCEKVCSFNDNYDTSLNLPSLIAYGVRHKNVEEVCYSRSGAAFVAISDYVLEKGGVVYGAVFDDEFRVIHKRATNKEQRNEFRGSKYVQSDLNSTLIQVKEDLKSGKDVLFSGTPCQTSAVNSFVGKNLKKNLILVDIVCHGTPSPYIWRDYLKYIEKEEGLKIIKANFRDKKLFGWAAHRESFTFENKQTKSYRIFTKLFYQHIMFRDSCGSCHFCNLRRPSDLTLADFWGWEKQSPSFNSDDKGVSLLFVNTEKGELIFNKIKRDLICVNASPDAYLQHNMQKPSIIHPMRSKFAKDYCSKGFEYILNRDYDKRPILVRLFSRLKSYFNRH